MSENIWSDLSKKEVLEDYTEYDRVIREHIEKFPKKIPAWCPAADYTGYYLIREVDEWLQQLKNKIGGYDESIVTHVKRTGEE